MRRGAVLSAGCALAGCGSSGVTGLAGLVLSRIPDVGRTDTGDIS